MTSTHSIRAAWRLALLVCASACGDDLKHVEETTEYADPSADDVGLDASASTPRRDAGLRDGASNTSDAPSASDGALPQSDDTSASQPDAGSAGSEIDASLDDGAVPPSADAGDPQEPDAPDEPSDDASTDPGAADPQDAGEPDAAGPDAALPDPVGPIPKVFLPAGCGAPELVARDGTYLGLVSSGLGVNSVCNEFGSFGNTSSPTSIFNTYGQYGSTFGINSAYNRNSNAPPAITCTNNKRVVAVVSKNKYAIAPLVVDPDVLCAALSASGL